MKLYRYESSQNTGRWTESIEEAKKYTEQEIKAVDERYWPFAVKVGNDK